MTGRLLMYAGLAVAMAGLILMNVEIMQKGRFWHILRRTLITVAGMAAFFTGICIVFR